MYLTIVCSCRIFEITGMDCLGLEVAAESNFSEKLQVHVSLVDFLFGLSFTLTAICGSMNCSSILPSEITNNFGLSRYV